MRKKLEEIFGKKNIYFSINELAISRNANKQWLHFFGAIKRCINYYPKYIIKGIHYSREDLLLKLDAI